MKKTTTYFGNRFKTAIGGLRKRASRVAVVPAAAPSSEFEALESRILLSGITAGSRVLKSLNYVDADGDKVSIKLVGRTPAGAGFQTDGLGNGFDVSEINLVGDLSQANLVISVTPSRLAPADRATANQLFSPGYTNIGSIQNDSANGTPGGGATAIRNIALNAAVVGDISLETTSINSITLGLGRTTFVDRINTASPTTGGAASSYVPSSGFIDLYDVSAKNIGAIVINGSGTNATAGAFPPGYTASNDFLGSITVGDGFAKSATVGNIGSITGVRSNLAGTLDATNEVGTINVGKLTGTINVGGDLTINLPDGSAANITAGGHIDLGWKGNTAAASTAVITAGAGISGLGTSQTDPIQVPSNFIGKLINTNTSATAGTAIADIDVIGGKSGAFLVSSANSVGNITAQDFGAVVVSAGNSKIGNVVATAGGIAAGATFTAATSIGDITTANGVNAGIFTAGTTIGNISGTQLITGLPAITGQFVAGNGIGNITAKAIDAAGTSAINGAVFNSGAGAILDVTSTLSVGTTGFSLGGGSTITAGTTIGKLTFTGDVGAAAITSGNLAGSTGNITSLTVNALTGFQQGFFNANVTANTGNIGNISIAGSLGGVVQAALGNISTGAGESITIGGGIAAGGQLLATKGNIGNVTVTGNIANGGGIEISAPAGNIGSITTKALAANLGNPAQAGDIAGQITAGKNLTGPVVVAGDLTATGLLSTTSGSIGDVTIAGKILSGGFIDANAVAPDLAAIATIGNVTVGKGVVAFGGDAIQADGALSSLTVTDGGLSASVTVGSITGATKVTNTGTLAADHAINANITAKDGIGAITATANAGNAINAGVTIQADNDGKNAGTLASVTATSATGSGIIGANLFGSSIGDIKATVTGDAVIGNTVLGGVIITASRGNVGNIEAKSTSANAEIDVIVNTTITGQNQDNTTGGKEFNSGSVGSILASNASTKTTETGSGWDAIENLTVLAGGKGTVGSITATTAEATSWQIFSNVAGQAGLSIQANQATTTLAADKISTVGAITANGLGRGIGVAAGTFGVDVVAFKSIGAVTGSGSVSNQTVQLNAPSIAGASFTFADTTNDRAANVTLGATVTQVTGPIAADNVGAKVANLTVTGGGALTALGNISSDGAADISGVTALAASSTVGNIAVAGQFTVAGVLANAKTVGTVNVGSFAAIGANTNIGVGGAGTSIGLVTVGANNAANEYQFRFAQMNGVTTGATNVLVIPAGNVTATAAAAAGGAASGGVRMILA